MHDYVRCSPPSLVYARFFSPLLPSSSFQTSFSLRYSFHLCCFDKICKLSLQKRGSVVKVDSLACRQKHAKELNCCSSSTSTNRAYEQRMDSCIYLRCDFGKCFLIIQILTNVRPARNNVKATTTLQRLWSGVLQSSG